MTGRKVAGAQCEQKAEVFKSSQWPSLQLFARKRKIDEVKAASSSEGMDASKAPAAAKEAENRQRQRERPRRDWQSVKEKTRKNKKKCQRKRHEVLRN